MNSFVLALVLIGVAVGGAFVATVPDEAPVADPPGLPRTGTICAGIEVRSAPGYQWEALYNLPAGEVVRLREVSRSVEGWVMIAPAEWIPMDALCEYQ